VCLVCHSLVAFNWTTDNNAGLRLPFLTPHPLPARRRPTPQHRPPVGPKVISAALHLLLQRRSLIWPEWLMQLDRHHGCWLLPASPRNIKNKRRCEMTVALQVNVALWIMVGCVVTKAGPLVRLVL
jgi:hypothetical protein